MEFKDCYIIVDETVGMDEDLFQLCFSEAMEELIVYLNQENINAISVNTETNFQKRVYWKTKQIVEAKGFDNIEVARVKGYRMLEDADVALFYIMNTDSEAFREYQKVAGSKRKINIMSAMNYEKYEMSQLYFKIHDELLQ